MTRLVPFNRRGSLQNNDFKDFYNMLDDFFNDSWLPGRDLLKDTFKIDIQETNKEYFVEAELPGIMKDEIDLGIEEDNLCITVNRSEETNKEEKSYIHRERRTSSMSRRIRLENANLNNIKAKLEEGILTITIPKDEKITTIKKIEIE